MAILTFSLWNLCCRRETIVDVQLSSLWDAGSSVVVQMLS